MTGAVVAVGSSLEGFHFDPKAGRPDRLRKTLRLIAEEVQRVMAWVMLGRGRSAYRCLFVTRDTAEIRVKMPHRSRVSL